MVDEQKKEMAGSSGDQVSSGRGKIIALVAVVALLIISAAVFFIFMQPEERFPLTATITNVEGSAMIQDHKTAGTIPANVGMEISEGDRIITGTDGIVEITFVDDSKTRVAPETRMDIRSLYSTADGAETTVLNVDNGKVWNAVSSLVEKNSRFEVNTPSSVAGVRGTAFAVDVNNESGDNDSGNNDNDNNENGEDDDGSTTYRVYEGEVGVSGNDDDDDDNGNGDDQDQLILGAFQQAKSSPNQPPPSDPDPIDPLEVDDFEKDSLVEDIPLAYIEVEVQTKEVLIKKADELLEETERELEILSLELSALEVLLRNETDPERRAELQYLISNINEEIDANRKITEVIKKDREELEKEKEELASLRETFKREEQELQPDDFKERVREAAKSARQREIERRPEREQRNNEVIEQQQRRESSRREVETTATKLGISETLNTIRQTPTQTTPPPATTPTDSTEPPPPPPAEPATYNISLSRNIAAGGTVTGGGTYTSGRRLTVTAVPSEGYRFVNWTSGGQNVSSDATYTFNVNSNRNLVANFARIRYSLTLSVNPSGSGTVSGSGTYDSGTTVTATATAASGYRFLNWTSGGRTVSSSRIYTFTITGNVTMTANFERVEQPTPDPTPDPDDPTDPDPDDPTDPDPDDPTDPDPDDPTDPDPDDPTDPDPDDPTDPDPDDPTDPDPDDPTDPDPDDPTDPDPDDPTDPDEPSVVIINASVYPVGSGTVSGYGQFTEGDYVILEVEAVYGYRFVNWTSNGTILSEEPTFSLEAINNMDVVANFEFVPFGYTVELLVTPTEGGEVTGGGTYPEGDQVTVSALPNDGYIFSYWLENDLVVSYDAEYTFVASERTLTAVFELDVPPVEITDITAKHVKVSDSIHAAYILFRLSVEPDYVEVSVNGEAPFTFVRIDDDGRYLFEGITESQPETVEVEIDGYKYTPEVEWEDAEAVNDYEPMEEDEEGIEVTIQEDFEDSPEEELNEELDEEDEITDQ